MLPRILDRSVIDLTAIAVDVINPGLTPGHGRERRTKPRPFAPCLALCKLARTSSTVVYAISRAKNISPASAKPSCKRQAWGWIFSNRAQEDFASVKRSHGQEIKDGHIQVQQDCKLQWTWTNPLPNTDLPTATIPTTPDN